MLKSEHLKRLQPLTALAVMVIALTLLSDKFLTFANQRNILLQISVNLCLSIGMTLIILTGGIDLSALAVMVVALTLLSDKFLTFANQRNILLQISVNLCLSIGMTLIILTGGIDLSVGAMLGLAGAVAAGLLKNGLVLKV